MHSVSAIDKSVIELAEFSYDRYRELIKLLKTRYEVIPLSQAYESASPYLILRHDIDLSLDNALIMAKMDSEMNVKSSFFTLFSYKYYNPLEKIGAETLRKIADLGHDIGLHYDLEAYKTYNCATSETLEREAKTLEAITGKKVVSIASHNNSLNPFKSSFLAKTSYVNAYDESLYDLYVSDSYRAWNVKSLRALLSFKDERVMLLIHPSLWSTNIYTRNELLKRVFQKIHHDNKSHEESYRKMLAESSKAIKYDEWTKLANRESCECGIHKKS